MLNLSLLSVQYAHMEKDVIPYIRFIHGYLFLLILYAFGMYIAGNVWEIPDAYLSWLLEFSASASIAYFVLSIVIIVLLVIKRVVFGKKQIVLPIIITVICSLLIIPVYGAAEGMILFLGM